MGNECGLELRLGLSMMAISGAGSLDRGNRAVIMVHRTQQPAGGLGNAARSATPGGPILGSPSAGRWRALPHPGLQLRQYPVDELNAAGALSDRGGHALHAARTRVSHDKDAG